MTRNVTGFYHDPPLFVREVPFEKHTRMIFFDRFTRVVTRCLIAQGLEISVTVQGLFGFDFSRVAEPGLGAAPPDHDDFEGWAESVVARTNVMNAFLAFFYYRLIAGDRRITDRMVVTPDLTIPMDNIERYSGVMTSNAHVSHLVMSGVPGTYLIGIPPDGDRRLVARLEDPPVTLDCINAAASDLSQLIEAHGREGVVIVDLFLRATKAYQDHNHSLSLISYWTIIERLINHLWQQMQTENESRDGSPFIDNRRRKTLDDSRTFTAAVMSEMLSFLGYIDKDFYDELGVIRRARNSWMHRLKAVSSEESSIANSVCERLLKQVMAVTVSGASQRRLHG